MSGARHRQPPRKGDSHVLHLRVLRYVAQTPATTRELAEALNSTTNEVGEAVRLLRQTNQLVVVGSRDYVQTLTRKLKVFSVPKAAPAKAEIPNQTGQASE